MKKMQCNTWDPKKLRNICRCRQAKGDGTLKVGQRFEEVERERETAAEGRSLFEGASSAPALSSLSRNVRLDRRMVFEN